MKSFIHKSILAILFICVAMVAQAGIVDKVSNALTQGDASRLAAFFNESVELVVLDKEGIYSKDQAKVIVTSFFNKYQPTKFTSLHNGGKPDATYVIGNLVTSSGQFRVYFLVKGTDSNQKVYQLRFEKE
ncbi:DUF4783 domain-containing protein [Halosquirtibacter laminarini]|uniref:DUF4783 domain-containing protein n=1 Tax=Halosquirtibacter laminarini TaxID=3374600 RepID=A0AC61ND30_9BACT|nr:DUF4783 domain-containing protein [Prolixibacteraceae bacterium]